MNIESSRLGRIEIDEEKVLHFPKGVPGFEQLFYYAVVVLEKFAPFSFLQSVKGEDVSFIVVDPFQFFQQYEFDLCESDEKELDIAEPQDISVWVMVSIQGELKDATVNLQAPIVINHRVRKGKQVILSDARYDTKHRLFAVEETAVK